LIAGLIFWYQKKSDASDDSVLYVGTNVEYQPFSFLDKNDQTVGFDIDIAREVCRRLNKQCEFVSMSFDALIPEIQLGTIHMIAAGMSPTAERAKRVFFTTAHLSGNPLVVVAPVALAAQWKNNFKQELLNEYRIAVNQGYISEKFVEQKQYPHIVRLSGSGVSEGLLALRSGQADVYVTARDAIKPFFDQDKSHAYGMITLEGTQESIALAISKQYPTLYKQVEEVLTSMRNDGTITQFIKKWDIV
jgi:arginine/lysine/histidine transporter system substrate-binding protein